MSKIKAVHIQVDLQNVDSVDGAACLLSRMACELGWDLVAFHRDIRATELPRNNVGDFIAVDMGWPKACVLEWVEKEFATTCPVAQHCSVADSAFIWYPEHQDGIWRNQRLTAKNIEALKLYSGYVAAAITVPVRHRGGHGYVSWFTHHKTRLSQLCEKYYADIFLLSHLFIQQLDRINAISELDCTGLLTAREEECLTWAARGKTAEEIGIILRRSRETARFHLRNAVSKLHASNRTHAVARAYDMGLISI